MKFIIFVIDNNIDEYLFVLSYSIGEETKILGELVKLTALCEKKDFFFDFILTNQNPNSIFFKHHIYINQYDSIISAMKELNIELSEEELKDFDLQNREVYNILTKKSKSEILSLLYQENCKYNKLLKKLLLK